MILFWLIAGETYQISEESISESNSNMFGKVQGYVSRMIDVLPFLYVCTEHLSRQCSFKSFYGPNLLLKFQSLLKYCFRLPDIILDEPIKDLNIQVWVKLICFVFQ